jgi:hypothetical protein
MNSGLIATNSSSLASSLVAAGIAGWLVWRQVLTMDSARALDLQEIAARRHRELVRIARFAEKARKLSQDVQFLERVAAGHQEHPRGYVPGVSELGDAIRAAAESLRGEGEVLRQGMIGGPQAFEAIERLDDYLREDAVASLPDLSNRLRDKFREYTLYSNDAIDAPVPTPSNTPQTTKSKHRKPSAY